MYVIGLRDEVAIWDYNNKNLLAKLSSKYDYPYIYSCSKDGGLLAVLMYGGRRVVMWDISIIRTPRKLYELVLPDPNSTVESICFMKTTELIVGVDNKVAVYDAGSGLMLRLTEVSSGLVKFVHNLGDSVISVSMSCLLQEWDTNLVEIRQHGMGGLITCIRISPSEDLLAISRKGNVSVVDLNSMERREILEGFRNVDNIQFNTGGNRILATHRYTVFVLDVISGGLLFECNSYFGAQYSVDSTYICGYCADKTLWWKDAETGLSIPCPTSGSAFGFEEHSWRLSVFIPDNILM
jgi:WD40 repeat protein